MSERQTQIGRRTEEGSKVSANVPGAQAEKPSQIPPRGWLQILRRAFQEAKDDNVPLLAAGVAFYAFLALFPALIALVTLVGLVADPATITQQVQSFTAGLPGESQKLITDQLTAVAGPVTVR